MDDFITPPRTDEKNIEDDVSTSSSADEQFDSLSRGRRRRYYGKRCQFFEQDPSCGRYSLCHIFGMESTANKSNQARKLLLKPLPESRLPEMTFDQPSLSTDVGYSSAYSSPKHSSVDERCDANREADEDETASVLINRKKSLLDLKEKQQRRVVNARRRSYYRTVPLDDAGFRGKKN